MTKGKRRHQRENAKQAPPVRQSNPLTVQAVGTEAVQDGVEGEKTGKAKHGNEENSEMPRKMGIAEWVRANLNAIMAIFTMVIAAAAVLQVFIYQAQLDEMRIDERAWLAVKFTPFPPPSLGSMVSAPAFVMNVGKTVAKDIDGWVYFRAVPIGVTIDVTEPSTIKKSSLASGEPIPAWALFRTGVIYPNDPVPLSQAAMVNTPPGQSVPQPLVWDQPLQDQWNRGEIYLALNGKFAYKDATGVPHWTTFCSVFVAQNSGKNISMDTSQICTDANTVDGNK
ncbi:MAG TPA: hypothetical protein VKG86_12855 [Terracidiphilus sp.]|nr:hypothetical protein [Terracidiphilus sp.]